MLKVGLLGLGSIGKVHLEAAYDIFDSENGPARVEACFDLCKENFALAGNARAYTDLDAFFKQEAGRLDFVDICLPTFMHKDVAIRAMESGFHVLCEKPMALSVEDAYEMCSVAKKAGKLLMVAQPKRFSADINLLREYIEKKHLGKLRSISCLSYSKGLPGGHNNWFKSKELSGGPIFDIHVHTMDTINYLLGAPVSVSTLAFPVGTDEAYAVTSSNFEYRDGVYVNIQNDWQTPVNKHPFGMRLNFERGYIIHRNGLFQKVDSEGNTEDLHADNGKGPFYKEIKYFSECIMNNSLPKICLPEDTAATIKIICAEITSSERHGERIIL